LALAQSIADNVTYSRLRPYSVLGWLNLRRRRRAVQEWLARLRGRCGGPEQAGGGLRGGHHPEGAPAPPLRPGAGVWPCGQPARGRDGGSKAESSRLVGELAAQGKGVLFVSSYLPELLGVCDRLAVMTRGRLSDVRPVTEWDADEVMACATGQASQGKTLP